MQPLRMNFVFWWCNKIPIPKYENRYNELVVQCEEDISYFIFSYQYYDTGLVSVNTGNVVVDENYTDDNHTGEDGIKYIKGYIEGNESITITGSVYYQGKLLDTKTKHCAAHNANNVYPTNNLQVPIFNGNSQGKLVFQCEENIVYYIMAYDCLRPDTKPSVTATGGNLVVEDELIHEGEVFYTQGFIERTGGSVDVTGHVYSGGKTLSQTWTGHCP